MEGITLFLVISAFAGLILQYWKKEAPFSLLTELLALGGLVAVIDDYNNTLMGSTPAFILVVAMIAVMIWSAWNYIVIYWPDKTKRR